jgi:hypothetical protein
MAWLLLIDTIVQYIPAWFPGATFRRVGLETERLMKRIRFEPFKKVESDLVRISSILKDRY